MPSTLSLFESVQNVQFSHDPLGQIIADATALQKKYTETGLTGKSGRAVSSSSSFMERGKDAEVMGGIFNGEHGHGMCDLGGIIQSSRTLLAGMGLGDVIGFSGQKRGGKIGKGKMKM